MAKVFTLFGADVIQRDLSFFLVNGVVSTKAAQNLVVQRNKLIKDVASEVDGLLDCLNIPKHALYAPIAADYVKYNASPNYGEVVGAKM